VIEFAALLLVSTLFGGMMLYSFGFAPMVFRFLPAEDASRCIRVAYPWPAAQISRNLRNHETKF
jgi:hypothetical protein